MTLFECLFLFAMVWIGLMLASVAGSLEKISEELAWDGSDEKEDRDAS